jgi:tetratricopeptide (TPR) repeat protein
MESSELSEEEREELAKALEALAKQLEKLASANESLSSSLAAAGLNEALASNPEAAKKAIENATELNEEQKKKLLELLQAQQNASKTCEKMAQGCKKCANGEGATEMASELEKMEAMQSFMTDAELAKMACQNAVMGMCPGEGTTGGLGQGNGGSNPIEKTETTSIAQRSPVNTVEGTIIARQLFEGGLLTSSESTAAVRETVLTEQRDIEQAIANEEVPRKYHDLLRHYFGRLEELTETSRHDADQSGD